MRTLVPLVSLVPLAAALILLLPGAARAFEEADFRSPDGRFELVALPDGRELGHGDLARGGLRLVDLRTGEELGYYDPGARAFQVLWSPGGKLVAVNADLGYLDNEITVWRVTPYGWRLAHLPEALRRGAGCPRALDELLPRAYAGRISYAGHGVVAIAQGWRGPSDLVATLALDGREGKRETHEILASFSVTIRFFRMGAEILEEKRTSFKVF